jgi:uncharacterized protein YkwD
MAAKPCLLAALLLLPPALGACVVVPSSPEPAREERRGAAVPGPSRAEAPGIEAEVFRLVNQTRRRAGLRELEHDPRLSEVARRHSRNMRDRDFFDHVDPAGRDLGDGLAAAGVGYRLAAENLGHVYNVPDPAAYLHRILMDSPRHRRNLLLPDARRAGIGVARAGTSYWLTEVLVGP